MPYRSYPASLSVGRDHHPRARQAEKLARKSGRKAPGRRVLVVCEGSKTEPLYFEEIRRALRLPSRNIFVTHEGVTHPRGIVDAAESLFRDGGPDFDPRAFELVVTVFDRDDHDSYHDALDHMARLDARKWKNDEGTPVRFLCAPTVPSFELWLLLHFQERKAALGRDEALNALKRHLPQYRKSAPGSFAATRERLPVALERAYRLAEHGDVRTRNPATDLHLLVHLLLDPGLGLPPWPATFRGDSGRIEVVAKFLRDS